MGLEIQDYQEVTHPMDHVWRIEYRLCEASWSSREHMPAARMGDFIEVDELLPA